MAYPRKYIPGDRPVECDICGFVYRFSQMRKGVMGNQKGFNVCPPCFDDIHPREIKVKHRAEGIIPEVR
jgi:hypothetical protein